MSSLARNARAALALSLVVSTGCAARDDVLVHEGAKASVKALNSIGVAPPVFLQDMPGALPDDLEPFFGGVYVGHVTHTGGFVRELTEDEGSPVRSKEYTFTAQDGYRAQSSEWLEAAFAEQLNAEKLQWSRLKPAPEGAVPTPKRGRVRGTSELDGTDNVNLPRFTLEPLPLSGPDALGAGYAAYLVPIVVYYYSHNGGWFIGQDKGCGGGGRVRVFWTLYDAPTGRPLTWRDVDVRSVNNYVNQPNGAQIDDFLIATEAKFLKELGRGLAP